MPDPAPRRRQGRRRREAGWRPCAGRSPPVGGASGTGSWPCGRGSPQALHRRDPLPPFPEPQECVLHDLLCLVTAASVRSDGRSGLRTPLPPRSRGTDMSSRGTSGTRIAPWACRVPRRARGPSRGLSRADRPSGRIVERVRVPGTEERENGDDAERPERPSRTHPEPRITGRTIRRADRGAIRR